MILYYIQPTSLGNFHSPRSWYMPCISRLFWRAGATLEILSIPCPRCRQHSCSAYMQYGHILFLCNKTDKVACGNRTGKWRLSRGGTAWIDWNTGNDARRTFHPSLYIPSNGVGWVYVCLCCVCVCVCTRRQSDRNVIIAHVMKSIAFRKWAMSHFGFLLPADYYHKEDVYCCCKHNSPWWTFPFSSPILSLLSIHSVPTDWQKIKDRGERKEKRIAQARLISLEMLNETALTILFIIRRMLRGSPTHSKMPKVIIYLFFFHLTFPSDR